MLINKIIVAIFNGKVNNTGTPQQRAKAHKLASKVAHYGTHKHNELFNQILKGM